MNNTSKIGDEERNGKWGHAISTRTKRYLYAHSDQQIQRQSLPNFHYANSVNNRFSSQE